MDRRATARLAAILLAGVSAACEVREETAPKSAAVDRKSPPAAAEPARDAVPAAEPAKAPAVAPPDATRTDDLDESDTAEAQGVPDVAARLAASDGKGAGAAAKPEPWMTIEPCTYDFHGKPLYARVVGDPKGRAVLLLHGAKFTSKDWQELGTLDLLARRGYRAVAIDLPGFGNSSAVVAKPEEFLHEALPLLDLKKPVVVFPSMSGTFALPFVATHSDEVSGLVPIAPVDLEKWAPKLTCKELPVLLLWGANDSVIPIKQADALVAALPQTEKVVLSGAEHACYRDKPAEFHQALVTFLKTLDPR
jgi:abhydrolase domain-containing protein 14